MLARQLSEATGEPVTAVNLDGYKGRRLLGEIRFPEGKLRLIEKRKSYSDYLRDVARHKIVLQLDQQPRAGPGGWRRAPLSDPRASAATVRLSELHFQKLAARAERSWRLLRSRWVDLKDADLRGAIVAESEQRALEHLSFQAVRSQLAKIFAQFAQGER